jgi:signal transduction histidine kinase
VVILHPETENYNHKTSLEEEHIKKLTAHLDERTMKLMERESELADQFEELESQKEELTAAVEEVIRKNNELTERNQELDQILYRASHDLRSPITSMLGILNLIKSESVSEGLVEYCFHMKQMIMQMEGVVNTLTLLGRSTQEEIKITPIDLHSLIEEEINHLSSLPNFKWIDFRKSIVSKNGIQTDEQLLRIVIRSLLANAITFRLAGQGWIDISVVVEDDLLHLHVKDNGEGIDTSIAPKIFDMFYRGSEKSIGQGMGLFLVKKIVNRLNGEIKWESTPGITQFRISIPVSPSPVS